MTGVDWAGAIVVSLTEFEVAWQAAGFDETPLELDPPPLGRTLDERRAVIDAALVALADRGLAHAGRPLARLASAMAVLAHRDLSVDVRMLGRSLVGGVAARRGPRAVLAVRHLDEIALVEVEPDRLTAAAADVVGPIDRGQGRVVNISAADLDAAVAVAGADELRFTDELTRRGTSPDDATALARMVRDVDRHGQFGATAGGRRAPYVVAVHRTPHGHFGCLRRPGPYRREVVTVGPLDAPTLLRHLDELTGTVAH